MARAALCPAQVVRLVDLLDEAKARCRVTIEERRAERNEPISPEVGRGAAQPPQLTMLLVSSRGRDAACVASLARWLRSCLHVVSWQHEPTHRCCGLHTHCIHKPHVHVHQLLLTACCVPRQELEEASNAMGYGAVKYADLKNQRLTNYKFNFDQMLNLTGNTAVYLLYAHARIAGIIRKSARDTAGGGQQLRCAAR